MNAVLQVPMPYEWEPLPSELEPAQRRLASILRAWEGTPYGAGQQCCKTAVDCVRFGAAVYDSLYRERRTTKRLPQDLGQHDPTWAIRATHALLRLYGPYQRILTGKLQPGDAVVTSERGGGPMHLLLVGPDRNTLWQATGAGVRWTGWGLIAVYQEVRRVYRLEGRTAWC